MPRPIAAFFLMITIALPTQAPAQSFWKCGRSIICWENIRAEVDAMMKTMSLQYEGLHGPPWAPCHFKAPGFKCVPFTFTFIGTADLHAQDNTSRHDFTCNFKAQGLGTLHYENLSREFQLNATAPPEYTGFTNCGGTYWGKNDTITTNCGNASKDGMTWSVYYDPAHHPAPLFSSSSPEPITCNSKTQDPGPSTVASFTDVEMLEMLPRELFDSIPSSYQNLTMKWEKKDNGFRHVQTGTLSIVFELSPDFMERTPSP